MASPTIPRKPSPEERDGYYYGFAGTPKLIARTSCNPWVQPTRLEEGWRETERIPIRKEYATLGFQNDIIPKWTPELVEELICSLRGCEWTFFFPIRTGLERTLRSSFPTILLIAVEDGTLSWDEGITIALGCREILRLHGIRDVEVEIREGRCHDLAASVEVEGLIDPSPGFGEINHVLSPLLSSPGYPVAYSEDRRGQGTIGLHVKLQGDDSIYGLTCRHVVHRDRPAEESYKFSPESKPEYHVHASTETLEDLQTGLRDIIEHLDEDKSHLRPTEMEQWWLDRMNNRLAYAKKFIDPLMRIEDKCSRKIGQLMFHSSLEFSLHQKGYLKDWALIKLDGRKFSKSPNNKIFVDTKFIVRAPRPSSNMIFKSFQESGDENGFVSLKQIYPSIMSTKSVCKRGATTGLTFGIKNEAEAVVRKPAGLRGDQYAWQMIIIPHHGRFSAQGDSGSCIFNVHGHIVGLLSSSDNKGDWLSSDGRRRYPEKNISPRRADKDAGGLIPIPDGMDITFADPIQWVFDDIERFTSRKVELV